MCTRITTGYRARAANRIAAILDAFTPDECTNYFGNAGYASSLHLKWKVL